MAISSPLVTAANKIVSLNRSSASMGSTQNEFSTFLRFMDIETKNLKSITFDKKKLKKAYGANVTSTFGNAGNLLSGLASGALDAASFIGDFFGRGGKGKASPKAGKAIPKGGRIRLPGVRGIPVLSTLLAGLDFAEGISQGESVGKAGAGAAGSAVGAAAGGAAGIALAGLIGQTVVPIPGLGFVLGAAVGTLGGMAGGYLADRAYEAATGEGSAKTKTQTKLKQLEEQQRIKGASVSAITFPEVVDKFDNVVTSFERAVRGGLLGPTSGAEGETTEGNEEPYEPDMPSADNTNQNTGELGDYSVSGGSLPSAKRGSPFGPRWGRNHNGIDYEVPAGTPISVVQPGTVSIADMNYNPGGWGALVEVHHNDGSATRYAHLSAITVSQGQKIEPGTMIGKSGGKPGAPGAGNSRGEHLHYEYLPKGSGPRDPSAGNNDDKYFRFGGNVTVKPKVQSQTGMMGQNMPQQQTQQTGSNATVSPTATGQLASTVPQTPPPTPEMTKNFDMAWQYRNNPMARGRIESEWNKMSPTEQQQAMTWAKSKGYDWKEMKLPEAKPIIQSQVQAVTQQPVAPGQIQQYPSYNQQQSSITFIPITQGVGRQQPMVMSSSIGSRGSSQVATVMPSGPSKGEILNSLMKNILLTSLSAT